MDQSTRPERALTARDLRFFHGSIIEELVHGHTFVIVHEGRPLARLVSLVPACGWCPNERLTVARPLLTRLETVLGQPDLARVLGLSLTTFLARRDGLQFSEAVHDRFDVVEAVIDDLSTVLKRKDINFWMNRPQKDLQGRSVLSTLALPWTKDDQTSTLVCHMARRERVKHLASRSGHRR